MNKVDKVKQLFQTMNKENIKERVNWFYAQDASFTDPVHRLEGVAKIEEYYQGLYNNVSKIHFDYPATFEDKDKNTVILTWKMTLETSKLNGGEPLTVEGNSVVTFNSDGKAIEHRDYFDMGEFIYENVPVIGFVIKKIKNRMKLE